MQYIYIPPHSSPDRHSIENLLHQLPPPYILLGDFNAHHPLWGSQKHNPKGILIENILLNNNITLLNHKNPTYIHPATGSLSSIDLTLCSPTIALNYTWSTEDDTHGNDHFPIIISSEQAVFNIRENWKLNKADWATFSSKCQSELTDSLLTSHDPIDSFTSTLTNIANLTIPKVPVSRNKPKKPWFNEDCKAAIRSRKHALITLRKHPHQQNVDLFRISRARTRRVIRKAKRESWQNFISTLNPNTPSRRIWNAINKIQGKNIKQPLKHLQISNNIITDQSEIANTIAQTIAYNSSNEHYSPAFRHYKDNIERHDINFTSINNEPYNLPLTLSELTKAIHSSHDSAPGPDNIHYQLLKHLPEQSLQTLLKIFNYYFINDIFPPSWHQANIIPIPKPNKDDTNPNNYRLIALTSCCCKIFER